jgi:hypothetical protein
MKNDPAEKRGAIVGAGIMVFLVAVICLSVYISKPRNSIEFILNAFLFLGILLGCLGYIVGGTGANCSNVASAFLSGAILCGIAPVFIFCFVLIASVGNESMEYLFNFAIALTCIISAAGALISGFGAIAARDYRRFQKMRIFPQFTLQELFIVSLLVAVILSAIASFPLMPKMSSPAP